MIDQIVYLVSLLFLIGPTVWLGFWYYIDFYSCGEKQLNAAMVIPLLGFMAYVAFVLIMGVEGTMEVLKDVGYKRGSWSFVFPGLGFAAAAFPYQVAERSVDFLQVSRHGEVGLYRLLGWLALSAVMVRHLVMFF